MVRKFVRIIRHCLHRLSSYSYRFFTVFTHVVFSGGASAVKEPGHFEVRKSPRCTFFLKKLTTIFQSWLSKHSYVITVRFSDSDFPKGSNNFTIRQTTFSCCDLDLDLDLWHLSWTFERRVSRVPTWYKIWANRTIRVVDDLAFFRPFYQWRLVDTRPQSWL